MSNLLSISDISSKIASLELLKTYLTTQIDNTKRHYLEQRSLVNGYKTDYIDVEIARYNSAYYIVYTAIPTFRSNVTNTITDLHNGLWFWNRTHNQSNFNAHENIMAEITFPTPAF